MEEEDAPVLMEKIVATYIWLDVTMHIRCKYRTLERPIITDVFVPPSWVCDGAACGLTSLADAEVTLNPIYFANNPLPDAHPSDIVVLCDCLNTLTGKALESNTRHFAHTAFANSLRDVHPHFSFVQEYILFDAETMQPWQWDHWFPDGGLPKKTASYCSVGKRFAIGREVALKHYRACLQAGLKVVSLNAEAMPGQWRFEIGALEGLSAADELVMARFFLDSICETAGLMPMYHPKPKRNCNGSACIVKYSNDLTRAENGWTEILLIVQNLSSRHTVDMMRYGKDNDKRLDSTEFTYGTGDKRASINIPRSVFVSKRGHFEDRRPGANCDPYVVCALIHESAVRLTGP